MSEIKVLIPHNEARDRARELGILLNGPIDKKTFDEMARHAGAHFCALHSVKQAEGYIDDPKVKLGEADLFAQLGDGDDAMVTTFVERGQLRPHLKAVG